MNLPLSKIIPIYSVFRVIFMVIFRHGSRIFDVCVPGNSKNKLIFLDFCDSVE
jgi:hypothetical protein